MNGLFEWQHPELPEDLALMSTRTEPWLETTAHEEYAFLHLSEREREELLASLPALAGVLSPAPEE